MTRWPTPTRYGLSPRVRENPAPGGLLPTDRRSIPACAGEPLTMPILAGKSVVYPRVCGGTPRRQCGGRDPRGLSPRVRGNHSRATRQSTRWRSIPACAGEPAKREGYFRDYGVYPRVCGGTPVRRVDEVGLVGLSPRVRGNPASPPPAASGTGSIPACAGEPARSKSIANRYWVYPRVCGGTSRNHSLAMPPGGLSPRVRGNLRCSRRTRLCVRSIPACAGEPLRLCMSAWSAAVYPRVCGGTPARHD